MNSITFGPMRFGRKPVAKRKLCTFRRALLELQGVPHVMKGTIAVAGMLHDAGPLLFMRPFVLDGRSLYKVIFLNLRCLQRLQVHYQPELKMYEDVAFIDEVLCVGGRTFKSQRLCFRALKLLSGGASNARGQGSCSLGTLVNDPLKPQPQVILRLLNWAQSHQ